MQIKSHWEECIQEVKEFKYLDQAMDVEFKSIKDDTDSLVGDILINTAPESILSRYEKILNLEVEQDIWVRRSNILNKLSNRTPFTKWWLAEKLNTLLGKDNFTLQILGQEYEIIIEVDMSQGHIFSSVQTQFLKQIPANMLLTPKLKITAAIGVNSLSKTYRFEPPICSYVTGIYPDISCLGKYGTFLSQVDTIEGSYLFDPEIIGLKPDISTLGKVASKEVQAVEIGESIPFSYKLCNTLRCGM